MHLKADRKLCFLGNLNRMIRGTWCLTFHAMSRRQVLDFCIWIGKSSLPHEHVESYHLPTKEKKTMNPQGQAPGWLQHYPVFVLDNEIRTVILGRIIYPPDKDEGGS